MITKIKIMKINIDFLRCDIYSEFYTYLTHRYYDLHIISFNHCNNLMKQVLLLSSFFIGDEMEAQRNM